jgi:hypothetical protein
VEPVAVAQIIVTAVKALAAAPVGAANVVNAGVELLG